MESCHDIERNSGLHQQIWSEGNDGPARCRSNHPRDFHHGAYRRQCRPSASISRSRRWFGMTKVGRPGLPTTIRSGSPSVTASVPGWIGPFVLWQRPSPRLRTKRPRNPQSHRSTRRDWSGTCDLNSGGKMSNVRKTRQVHLARRSPGYWRSLLISRH